jgi:hypothetical protein
MTKKLIDIDIVWTVGNERTGDDTIMFCRACGVIGVYEDNAPIAFQNIISQSSPTFDVNMSQDYRKAVERTCLVSLKQMLKLFDVSTLRFDDLIENVSHRNTHMDSNNRIPVAKSAIHEKDTRVVRIAPCPVAKTFDVLKADSNEVILLVMDTDWNDQNFFAIDVAIEQKFTTRNANDIHYGRPRIITSGQRGGVRLLK